MKYLYVAQGVDLGSQIDTVFRVESQVLVQPPLHCLRIEGDLLIPAGHSASITCGDCQLTGSPSHLLPWLRASIPSQGKKRYQ
jgi:hypothetical protein